MNQLKKKLWVFSELSNLVVDLVANLGILLLENYKVHKKFVSLLVPVAQVSDNVM